MRCLALAQALRSRGAHVVFVCAEHDGHLIDRIEAAGVVVLRVPAGLDEVEDAAATLGALENRADRADRAALVGIVDHYGLGLAWERVVRPHVARLLVIDDLPERVHDAQLLLDQNLRPGSWIEPPHRLPSTGRALLGPRYALLRAGFAEARQSAQQQTQQKEQVVLICFGGADPQNLSELALSAFVAADVEGWRVEVVLGPAHPYPHGVIERWRGRAGIDVVQDPPDLVARMTRAGLFVGSGGSISWERACLGLPGITVSLAENQAPLCEALAEAGGDVHAGAATMSAAALRARLAAALSALTADAAWRRGASRRLMTLCDGRGADRVARALLAPAISLRPAVAADAVAVFPWRNDPRTRALFFDPSPLLLDSHCAWFARAVADPRRRLLIGAVEGVDVGVARFDLDEDGAELSVYLDPDAHGQGLGPALIEAACAWLATHEAQDIPVRARIRSQNAASLAAFTAAGFAEVERVFVRPPTSANRKATT